MFDAPAQLVESRKRVAGSDGRALVLIELSAQRAQRCVLACLFRADVLPQRIVDALERAARRIFARAAVERVRERIRNDACVLAVIDRHLLLAHVGRVPERIDPDAEVRLPRYERTAVAELGSEIRAVAVVDARGFRIVVTRDFDFATVGERVRERRYERAAVPGPPEFLASLEPVERGRDRRAKRRFAALVLTEDHVESRPEREPPVAQSPESRDAQRSQDHGAISVPSNAATIARSAASACGLPLARWPSRSAIARPRTLGSSPSAA